MSKHRLFSASLAAAALAAALVVPVLATPASGLISGPILARGDFAGRVDVKFKVGTSEGVEISSVAGAGDVAMQRIELGPGGSTGWHTHPGPAVAIVQSGAITISSAEAGTCEQVTYEAGDSFVDHGQGHVHLGQNASMTANVVVFVTYFDVGAAGVRINVDDPGGC